MTVSPAALLGWALVCTVTADTRKIPSVWDTLVLVAPAGSRFGAEALGFRGGPVAQGPASALRPRGSELLPPYLLQAGVQFRNSFLFPFSSLISHTIGISQP